MRKRIKSSLWLKIFLLLTTLLFAVSILLYGTIMAVMPASYKYALTSNYTEQVSRLVADLEHHDLDDATRKIYEFCINNNAGALLSGNQTSLTFGEGIMEEQQREQNVFQTVSASLALADGTYALQISEIASTAVPTIGSSRQKVSVSRFTALADIVIASYFVTRLLTKPILEISDISKRLTSLDMTWRCDTSRTDEVGTLKLWI